MSETKTLTWRGKLAMLILSPLVVFGLLEAGLRVAGYRYEPWTETLEGRTHDELRQTELYAPDPDLIWKLRPSSVLDREVFGFPRVRTNASGLRGEELPRPGTKAPGELRILCLGNSITFGLGLRAGETWPDRMAAVLREAPELAGGTVRVVNAGVPGYSSVQGMRLFERLRELEFDVIIFHFGMNDSRRMRVLPDSALSLPTEGVSGMLSVFWKLRVFQLVQEGLTSVRQTAAEGTRVSREEFREHVRRMRELEREGGPRVIFVAEPECCDLTIAQLERVVARAEEEDVDLVLAPRALLSWVYPAPEGVDLIGQRVVRKGKAMLRFPADPSKHRYERVDHSMSLDELRSDLDLLRDLKRALDGLMEELPQRSLDYEALFGDAPPRRVFVDNCHHSAEGARLAGQALAKEVLRRLR